MFTDDEVSIVLQHFRPQPEFLSAGKKRQRGFTSVVYKDRALKLCYLYNGILPLRFQVSCNEPYQVCCELCVVKSLQNQLQDICTLLNQDVTSLFSVVSRLLLSLHKLSRDVTNLSPMHTSKSVYNLDLFVFLMRCAAASRNNSTTLCTPIPHFDDCIVHDPKSVILAMTNQLDSFKKPTTQQPCSNQEQMLLAFLSALPWANNGKLASTTKGDDKTTKILVSLNLQVGDETPYFISERNERGVIRAFHGTQVENVWSILNHGLLYNKTIQKNGSILGEGVYLTTSFNVAYFFATSNAKPLHPQVWQHSSFWKLTNNMMRNPNDNYRVSCYAVVEANILLPPKSPRKDCTRRDGTYYVVPNPQDISMTKIHLTIEVSKQWSISPFLWVTFAILTMVYLSLK